MKKLLVFAFLIMFSSVSFSQEYEFIGVLKFSATSMISYRIVFVENNGKISGYSITDLQGDNETKNKIEGVYDAKTKKFSFSEKDIDYTKSKITQKDFCYVHFKGKLESLAMGKIKGDFTGLFKNGAKCINGTVQLVSSEKANKRMQKFTKKIQKKKSLSEEVKQKANLNKMLDSLKVSTLKKDDIASVFFNANEIELEIWDAGKEDGDKVTVFVDNKPVLTNYEIKNISKTIKVTLKKGEALVKIVALNNGAVAPNTAKVKLKGAGKDVELITNIEKDNSTSIRIIKRAE